VPCALKKEPNPVAKSNGVKELLTLDERMLKAAKALRIPVSMGIRI